MEKEWNPIFYVAFLPILIGAMYMVICVIGGMCSKKDRQARADHERARKEAAAVHEQATSARKRPAYSGPDFRRGARSPGHA